MDDPYKILGVERGATEADIRTAYRKLAKQYHPDLNPGKPEAEEKFKAVASAHALLSDPEQRARYDRGEIDASGQEKPQERKFYRDFGDDESQDKYRAQGHFDADGFEDIFAQAFGRRDRAGFGAGDFGARDFGGGFAPRGDIQASLTVEFLDAANGAVRRLTLPGGQNVDVTIPAGLQNGQVLRLKGKGVAAQKGIPAGDLLIEVTIAAHPFFVRSGDDILIDLPVTLQEAVLGAKISVPTVKGPVSLSIPANSVDGARLRLKGRGIGGGHQYVTLRIVLPTQPEPELAAFLEGWKPRHPFDPRAKMEKP
jgi:DnaJ-class molecular chaperone